MKKLVLSALALGCAAQTQAVDVLKLTNVANKSNDQVMFIAWRYDTTFGSTKSDYERLLPLPSDPDNSTDSSLRGRSTLQVELGPKTTDFETYKKDVNNRLTKITSSRVNITLDSKGIPQIAQDGKLNKGLELKTTTIKNDSDHVLFIAWALDFGVGKSKSKYVRLMPGVTKDFDMTIRLRDALQVEVGPKADEKYKKAAKKFNQEITKKRVDLTVDNNGYPVITQE